MLAGLPKVTTWKLHYIRNTLIGNYCRKTIFIKRRLGWNRSLSKEASGMKPILETSSISLREISQGLDGRVVEMNSLRCREVLEPLLAFNDFHLIATNHLHFFNPFFCLRSLACEGVVFRDCLARASDTRGLVSSIDLLRCRKSPIVLHPSALLRPKVWLSQLSVVEPERLVITEALWTCRVSPGTLCPW